MFLGLCYSVLMAVAALFCDNEKVFWFIAVLYIVSAIDNLKKGGENHDK
jgi:hypothetical protein